MILRLQYLDVDDPSTADPTMLAKMLLHLDFLNLSQSDGPLWIQESKLVFKELALYIPRVRPLDTINRRSAAGRQQVTQMFSLNSRDTAIVLNEHKGAFELQAVPYGASGGIELLVSVRAFSLRTSKFDGHEPFVLRLYWS
jgi:hypothetical protein